MKTFIIILSVLLFFSCATVEAPGGFKYTRFWNQELVDVTIKMETHPDGTVFLEGHVGRQLSEQEISEIVAQIILEALKFYGVVR